MNVVSRTSLVGSIALALLGSSWTAQAADQGFYVGANLGGSSVDIDQDDLDASIVDAFTSVGLDVIDGESSVDDSDTTWSIAVGYQFNPYVAIEAAWVDLGEASYEASGTVSDGESVFDADIDASIGAQGPALSLIGIWPFAAGWSADARVGVFFADVDADVRLSDGVDSESLSDSESSESALFGLGIAYHLNEQWAVRADLQRYSDVGDEDATGEADVDTYTIGVRYAF